MSGSLIYEHVFIIYIILVFATKEQNLSSNFLTYMIYEPVPFSVNYIWWGFLGASFCLSFHIFNLYTWTSHLEMGLQSLVCLSGEKFSNWKACIKQHNGVEL